MTENGSPFRHVHVNVVTSTIYFKENQTMKKLAILAALVLTTDVNAYGVARAATVQAYQQPAFEAAQEERRPNPDLC